ncbi:hypothetical protein BJ742DRAFT_829839 [Cladochytrium replicatum]|nr:hypothetical protein BJ742DRAFT_829839 [Cladochytrium replicatum]
MDDPELSRAIHALAETLAAKLAQKDAEIARLRSEVAARDSALHDAHVRIESLESNLARADRSLADMSGAIERLTKFKSAVLEAEEDEVVTGFNDVGGARQQKTSPGAFGQAQRGVMENERQERQGMQQHQQLPQMEKMEKISVPPALVVTPSDFEDSRAPMVSGASPTFPINYEAYIPDKTLRFYAPQTQARPTVATNPQQPVTAANSRWSQQQQVQQHPNTGSSSIASLPPSREPLPKHHQQEAEQQQNKATGHGQNQHAGSNPSTPVDGREFFKRARGLLSYDEFTTLLWNVRAYNAREQSRQNTLENVEALMGEKHRRLNVQFENMVMGR